VLAPWQQNAKYAPNQHRTTFQHHLDCVSSFLTLIAEHVAINIKRNGLARMGSRVQASGLLHVAELIGAAAEVLLKVDGKNVAHTTVKRSAPAALIASDTTAELFDHAFAFSLSFIQGFVGGRQ